MTNRTLGDRFSELEEILGDEWDIDDVKESLEYGEVTIGEYTFEFIDGYTGCEGGGDTVDFLCRIKNHVTLEEEYYQVGGWYSSWSDGEIHWDDALRVTPKEKQIMITRTTYYTDSGKAVYKTEKDN